MELCLLSTIRLQVAALIEADYLYRHFLRQSKITNIKSYRMESRVYINSVRVWGRVCAPSCLVRISVVVMGHDETGGQLSGARARGHVSVTPSDSCGTERVSCQRHRTRGS